MKKRLIDRRSSTKWSKDAVLACDLFSGAGGFSLGAHLAGVELACAVEWNKHACSSYRDNLISSGLTKARLFEADIAVLEPAEVVRECGFEIRGCDILLGGPPCQGFSAHRINDAGVNDPRNDLLLRYFEFVQALRPIFFLVENVPGLLWPRHKDYLVNFYSHAKASGYGLLEPVVINARDFGVPQNRRRVFILGYDLSRVSKPPLWPPPPTHGPSGSETGLPEWVPASTVFSTPARDSDPNDVHMRHGKDLIEAFKRTPANGGSRKQSGRLLPCHEEHSGHNDVYGRINPSGPAPTMTTACINPSKGRFVHPTENHGITLRQAARIQSFPDWYIFSGGLMAGGAQVGNAVPVELAAALLKPLKSAVERLRKASNS